jgi:inosose dehydratase
MWGEVLFEYVLDDVAAAGYHGVELHPPAIAAFERHPARLRALLEERTLAAAGAPFVGVYYDKSERRSEIERLRRLADFLAEVATEGVVAFRTERHPARRDMIAGELPLLPLTRDRMAHLADALNQFGDLCRDFGLKGALQNRVGTYVETPDEWHEAAERTDAEVVWLAPDLGHWAYAGGDPVRLIRDYRPRLAYPRLKDFDPPTFVRIKEERLGYRSFAHAGGFRELGQGALPLEAALAPLVNAAYGGWVCVELERTEKTPRESAAISRDFLRERLRW